MLEFWKLSKKLAEKEYKWAVKLRLGVNRDFIFHLALLGHLSWGYLLALLEAFIVS